MSRGSGKLGRYGGIFRNQLGHASIPNHARDVVAIQEQCKLFIQTTYHTLCSNILYGTFQDSPFPISNLTDADPIGKHCSELFVDINKSWDPLISAALGYAQ